MIGAAASNGRRLIMPTKKIISAWHFLPNNKRTRFIGEAVVKNKWLRVDPEKLELCVYGLHASKNIIDALKYAPGMICCRVEISGKMLIDNDKICAEKRRVVGWFDARDVLIQFACMCALDVIDKWEASPEVISFLKNPLGYSANVAYSAANAAAYAAYSAANAAAYAAERDAQNEKLTEDVCKLLGVAI
jgi:hypothetical protein